MPRQRSRKHTALAGAGAGAGQRNDADDYGSTLNKLCREKTQEDLRDKYTVFDPLSKTWKPRHWGIGLEEKDKLVVTNTTDRRSSSLIGVASVCAAVLFLVVAFKFLRKPPPAVVA